MITLYRLVYKNGDHGAWDDDIDRIREYAKFFHAEIAVGCWDYDKIRNQDDDFTEEELKYIECDTLAGVECIQATLKC